MIVRDLITTYSPGKGWGTPRKFCFAESAAAPGSPNPHCSAAFYNDEEFGNKSCSIL